MTDFFKKASRDKSPETKKPTQQMSAAEFFKRDTTAPPAPQKPSSIKQLPEHVGGGQFRSVAGDPNALAKTPRGRGTFETKKGFEVDHKIPVSLGGTSSDPNLQYLESKPGFWRNIFDKPASLKNRQEGKVVVELSAINDYKAGKISLAEARARVLNWNKQPKDFKTPVLKGYVKDVVDTYKQSASVVLAPAANIALSFASMGTSALDFMTDFIIKRPSKVVPQYAKPFAKTLEDTTKWAEVYEGLKEKGIIPFKKANQAIEKIKSTPALQPSNKWQESDLKYKLTKGLPETVLALGPDIVASMGMFAINPAVGLTVISASTANDVKDTAIRYGVEEENAEALGLGTGILVGMLEKIVPTKILKGQSSKFANSLAKRIVENGILETGTEIAQETVQMLAERTFRDDMKWDEVATRTAMAGLGGLLGGVGMSTVVEYTNMVREKTVAPAKPEEPVAPAPPAPTPITPEVPPVAPEAPPVTPTPTPPVVPTAPPVSVPPVAPEVKAIPKKLEPLAQEAKKFKTAEEFVDSIANKLYKLNKRAKGEGVIEYGELGDARIKKGNIWVKVSEKEIKKATNTLSSKELNELYSIKTKILKKYGTPTKIFHRFPGGKVGVLFKIGNKDFHLLGFSKDLIDDLTQIFPDMKYSYEDVNNIIRIPNISSELKEGVGSLTKEDFNFLKNISDIKTKSQLTDIWKQAQKAPKVKPTPKPTPKATPRPSKLQSSVYQRLKDELPSKLKEDVGYSEIRLKEDARKAVELMEKDKNEAYRVAIGVKAPPEGQTATGVNIAMAEKALTEGNYKLYSELVKNRSLAQTRRGQEIVAEKGSITDNSTSRYVKELISSKLDLLGAKYMSGIRKTSTKERALEVIDKEVAKVKEKTKGRNLGIKEAQALIDSLVC